MHHFAYCSEVGQIPELIDLVVDDVNEDSDFFPFFCSAVTVVGMGATRCQAPDIFPSQLQATVLPFHLYDPPQVTGPHQTSNSQQCSD